MISILYEHKDFFIVDKPAGIGFHDEHIADKKVTGFFNLCVQQLNEQLFPLHRLDKLTSGLMILGRNKSAAQWFQQAFADKQIEKIYIALANAKPKKKQGSIIGDMEKSRNSQWKLSKTKVNPAVTRFFSYGIQQQNVSALRLFLIKPETGKTHQIRVALKSLGAAILGDELYGGSSSDRGYLHAYALRFTYHNQEYGFKQLPTTGLNFVENINQINELVEMPFDKPWPSKK